MSVLNNESDLFRLNHEPCAYFNEIEIHGFLTTDPVRYYRFIKRGLARIALGQTIMEMPPKLIFSDPGNNGDFRVMPCVIQDHDIRIKTVKLVGTNVRQRRVTDQITVGKAFLVDDAENFISHVFEACLLSSARTAICACLAMELLCGRGATLTVVGAGRVGYYTAFYALALGFAETVVISDIDENRARRTVTALKSRYPGVSISSSDYMSLRHTDVLALATTSVKPVYHPDHFRAGLVISMGADVDYQHELDPAIARISRLFVDTKDCLNYGDLKAWLENGLIAADTITDIFSLLNNYEPDNESIPAVFISTGSGVFDNLTISYLVSESGR